MYYMNIMDSSSLIMNELILLNDHLMMIMFSLMLFLTNLSYFSLKSYFIANIKHLNLIESIWSLIPTSMILVIIFPSIYMVYLTDNDMASLITIKIIGNQWYWSYENNENYMSSFMLKDVKSPNLTYLEVDNKLILPYNINIRFITSSMDVIHSWTIQSLGIKLDAIPNHLNQCNMTILRPGIYYGQCSEICGINHSFMPICMESININYYIKSLNDWLMVLIF